MTKSCHRHLFVMYCVCLLVTLSGCGQPAGVRQQSENDDRPSAFGRKLDVRTNGARGDGATDDTDSIQAVINKAVRGDTVFIPSGTYLVRTLKLRSGIHIKGDGLLKQPEPSERETYTDSRQHSKMPLFRAHRVSDIYVSFRAETVYEAIYVSTSNNITIAGSQLKGAAHERSFPGILLYQCRDCAVIGSDISQYGVSRKSAQTYQPGTGIRVLASNRLQITDNKIHHNGENGIFSHATENVTISRNHIHHNGMSAVQIAFGSTALERNFVITNNRFEYNAADAVDINNRTSHESIPIKCLIAGNYSRDNGFVNGQATPDGSGIATLINVGEVEVRGNFSYNSNRPALYLENCGNIGITANHSDGVFEIVNRFGKLNFRNNTFATLLLLANASGQQLHFRHNTIGRVALPSGIQTDTLLFDENSIGTGPLNINLSGHIVFSRNELRSSAETGALLLVKASGALISNNSITSTKGFAIATRKGTTAVVIDSNRIESVEACIFDDGSEGLTVTNNTFISRPGGKLQRTFMSTNPLNLVMEGNEHRAGKSDNSIRLLGQGTARIRKERFISGFPDYGNIKVETDR